MHDVKLVIEYSNMGYNEVMQLPCDVFQLMKKNQFIINLNQTEEGRQYLADCERFKQTKPDVQGLRNNFS